MTHHLLNLKDTSVDSYKVMLNNTFAAIIKKAGPEIATITFCNILTGLPINRPAYVQLYDIKHQCKTKWNSELGAYLLSSHNTYHMDFEGQLCLRIGAIHGFEIDSPDRGIAQVFSNAEKPVIKSATDYAALYAAHKNTFTD